MREKHELEMEILKCELEIKKKMLENLTKQVPKIYYINDAIKCILKIILQLILINVILHIFLDHILPLHFLTLLILFPCQRSMT